MKRAFTILLALLIIVCFAACSKSDASAPQSITVNGDFVLVVDKDADNTAQQAAVCLQATLAQKFPLFELPIGHTTPEKNAIVLHVDSSMAPGECTLELKSSGIYLTAQESHILLHAARQLRQALLDSGSPTVTQEMCSTVTQTLTPNDLPFVFLSQNLLSKDADGGNLVADRTPRFEKLMKEYQPDILGTQECSLYWKQVIDSSFGDSYISTQTAANWDKRGNPIYFRADRYEILDAGIFWLSPTPYIFSQFEGDSGPRQCTWALVKDLITNQELLVANCHPDWNNDTQRALQVNVIFQELGEKMQGTHVILCGDFNSEPDGPIYTIVTGNGLLDSHKSASLDRSEVDHTFHGFGADATFLDYIFHSDTLETNLYRIASETYGGYISDHYGVLAELKFK